LILYASLLLRRYSREPFRQIRLRVAKINAFLNENIAGMIVTQLFNLQKQNFQKFDALNQSYLEANIRTIFYFAVFFPVIELLSSISIALILGYGGWLILGGMLTLGALFAFLQYTERFFYPLRDLSEKYNILLSAFASAERIFTLLDTEVEIQSPLSPVKNLNGKGRIEFNNVTFGYDKGQPVLHNISFTVEPGETLAIVGHTGAGKTTLFNLLCRFYDVHQGAIMVDNLDIRDLNLKDLRRRIGLVQQDLFLFSGTIEYNISLEHQRSDPMAVKEFARTARAHDFIQKKLPQGYNTVLGERGATLSIGQRQLLSFARALAVNPEILLLDEATSSIDPETEKLIQDGLKVLLKGRTSIVIAHRLSTIREADRIIVLHKGRIRETGTHDELLKLKGIYHKLYQIQTGNMIENTCLETIS
jgi:ABC-type multidrug transport system fused ATPase/permease subunit